nr:hypothetical protein [Microbacterium amylolyticum]
MLGGVGALGVIGVFALVNAFPTPDDLAGPRDDGSWPWSPSDPVPRAEYATPIHAPRGESADGFLGLPDPEWVTQTALATGIPERALAAYAAADIRAIDEYGCAVGWNTLAGIGWVESYHGTIFGGQVDADGVARPAIIGIPLNGTNNTMAIPDTDGGLFDGDTEWDRAVGPMQFIPETWRRWAVNASEGVETSPHSIDDAAITAARYLCRLDGSLESEGTWIRAIRSYNDLYDYQTRVAQAAERYADAAR